MKEYVEAFRVAGLRVGLYYSVADWRIPAYWDGPQNDPAGFERFRQYVHNQVRELLGRFAASRLALQPRQESVKILGH